MTTIRIKRRFAVVLEDAISVPLPAEIDPADQEAVDEWALENYDDLYCAATDPRVSSDAVIDWEDEHKLDLDFPDTEYITEVLG